MKKQNLKYMDTLPEYRPLEVGDQITYSPTRTARSIRIGGACLDAFMQSKGLNTKETYVVSEADEPQKHCGETTQRITIQVNEIPMRVWSEFFIVEEINRDIKP